MALTFPFEDTATITTGGETSLTANASGPVAETSDGVFVVLLNLSNMAIGNSLRLRVYEKVRASEGQILIDEKIFDHVQYPPGKAYPLPILGHGWDVTLQAVSGSFDVSWSIRKVAP